MNTSSTHVQEIGDPLLDEMSMSIFDSVSAPLPDGMGAIAQRDGFGASTCDSNGGHRRKPVVSSSKFDFPFRLHDMLNAASSRHAYLQDIGHITWMPDGRSFKILNTTDFAQKTLPKFFVGIQYKSFIRQLNIYGFLRDKDRTSENYGEYSHPMFLRGEPDLCLFMTRQKIKGTGIPRGNGKSNNISSKQVLVSWNTNTNKALSAASNATDALLLGGSDTNVSSPSSEGNSSARTVPTISLSSGSSQSLSSMAMMDDVEETGSM
eukprot:CAMPEP_0178809750 /NCGR_PEP_ID=MMETSP0745-20121128/18284_1 /TAXON_ID=913974 /ORGANISM="Nitzschia punctata, Strain CCMP561" /LENGTH=263 /DNA_ID=CAMNT_0020470147 /DNA_START=124 /DNA_END=915 /DNA_ORIENTATION=-